jgi:hypothetical protein
VAIALKGEVLYRRRAAFGRCLTIRVLELHPRLQALEKLSSRIRAIAVTDRDGSPMEGESPQRVRCRQLPVPARRGACRLPKGPRRILPTTKAHALSYAAEAQIGGKIAQLGQRLVLSASKKIADDFFAKFASTVGSA